MRVKSSLNVLLEALNKALIVLWHLLQLLCLSGLLVLAQACSSGPEAPANDEVPSEWNAVLAKAQGQEVGMLMWMGDPQINAYIQDFVVPQVRDSFGIALKVVPAQGPQIVQMLLAELEAGRSTSTHDIVWINGETFYQLRQLEALWGPWTERLPNAALIDFDNPFIGQDFQQPIAGYELPWGNVQMTLIYDSTRVQAPPRTRADLLAWTQAHPGRFTWDSQFTGLTFLKALYIDIAGGNEVLKGDFNEALYAKTSAELWAYLRQLQPHLWREGRTFPEGVAQMHQMFANGELDFTMSNNDSEVDNKRLQGVFSPSTMAYAPDFGTIQNSHYLGVTALSEHKAAAMVVANFLVSPAAQLRKAEPAVWGDGSVLDRDKLPANVQAAFAALPGRVGAPPRATLEQNALQELAPEYMIRLAADFRTQIIGQ